MNEPRYFIKKENEYTPLYMLINDTMYVWFANWTYEHRGFNIDLYREINLLEFSKYSKDEIYIRSVNEHIKEILFKEIINA